DAQKFHLIGVLLLCIREKNKVPNDAAWVTRQVHATEQVDLEKLRSAGFLVPWRASKMLDNGYQDASEKLALARADAPSQEVRRKKKEVPTSQRSKGPRSTSAGGQAENGAHNLEPLGDGPRAILDKLKGQPHG